MLLYKFNLLLVTLFFSFGLQAGIDGLECLQSEFTASVSHKGFPFGLTQNILKLNKKNCELTLEHEKLKFMKKKWLIDVCRAPVHIKSGTTGEIEVIKKKTKCGTNAKAKNDEFCKTLTIMEQIIQDDGLIFAKGEKENISSEHGKIYCTYVLLRSYLRFNKVLSRTDSELKFDLENPSKKIVKEVIVEKTAPQGTPSTEPGMPSQTPVQNRLMETISDETVESESLPTHNAETSKSKEIGTF
jgi:hypothetical protein